MIAGAVAVWAQRQRIAHERSVHEETHKTEFVAEATARYFLQHPKYTDRSFDHLRKRLGGFDDEELRKILVRAGATRIMRKDGSEWWRLLDREEEALAKKKGTASPAEEEDISS